MTRTTGAVWMIEGTIVLGGPTEEAAIRKYPATSGERKAERDRLTAHYVAQAAASAPRYWSSPKCADTWAPLHAGQPGGCTNTGSTCLCPCHEKDAA